jgi:hypothetical protein
MYPLLKPDWNYAVSQNSSRERSSEVSKTDFMSREVDAAVAAASKNVADDDQPLSTWFGGVHASTSLGELSKSKHLNDPSCNFAYYKFPVQDHLLVGLQVEGVRLEKNKL